MQVIEILNTIRDNASAQYQERIPEATAENLREVGSLIMSYQVTKNEFCDAVVNKIAMTDIANRRFQNPLKLLKQGAIPFGTTVESIFTNPVGAKTFNANSGASELFAVAKPDVKTVYYTKNRADMYEVSINNDLLKGAFTGADGWNKFYQSIINALYSGDEIDEFLLMRDMIGGAISENKLKTVTVPYSKGDTEEFIILLKTLSKNMTLPSNEYNGYNVLNAEAIAAKTLTPAKTWTTSDRQIIIIRSDVDARTDVEVLAKAFNMSKVEFEQRKFVVDTFGDPDVLCFLGDSSAIRVQDTLYEVGSDYNPHNLTTKYILHHHQLYNIDLFANGVVVKQEA